MSQKTPARARESLAHRFTSGSVGSGFEDALVSVFFGQKNSGSDQLRLMFPDYVFHELKQVHSNDVALITRENARDAAPAHPRNATSSNSPSRIVADAQITHERRVALCIRTADCLPVLIHDTENGWVAAIHAGWRGVENEIIRHTGRALLAQGASPEHWRAWIGPHIHRQSFEVGHDVAARLLKAHEAVRGHSRVDTPVIEHHDPAARTEKAYVDLTAIVRAQLASIGVDSDSLFELNIDSFTSTAHESFRRDRSTEGRQISFIALK
jgi:YfiH family protein